jgi:hypothetical protein
MPSVCGVGPVEVPDEGVSEAELEIGGFVAHMGLLGAPSPSESSDGSAGAAHAPITAESKATETRRSEPDPVLAARLAAPRGRARERADGLGVGPLLARYRIKTIEESLQPSRSRRLFWGAVLFRLANALGLGN